MTGEELVSGIREARERQRRVIDSVCGACDNKCCRQMTMMGSQDLRRLLRGMLLDPEFERSVRAGLRRVGDRLEADLRIVRQVTELLAAAHGDQQARDLAELRANVEEWGRFIAWLRSDFALELPELRRLLMFSAIRSTPSMPGPVPRRAGRARQPLGQPGRLPLPRPPHRPATLSVWLDDIGCICLDAKPAKCANFFCAGCPTCRGAAGRAQLRRVRARQRAPGAPR